ncbi:MAG: MFS transporter [Gammaproteobacteria bacterium]|jgi:AAHS family benzoate transporter-like MFS transporter|nr:MFS transporter [Gammaproteobacteria bacterium]HAU93901.1 aromatic acid/H+ symport family MFS transporter [Alteromonas sp.]|tara:strand:+ start:88 stop:1425 length:1338 start_codon:yes stop_codon:yes gene_type:complete
MNSALTALIDNAKFNRFHLRTLLLCALIIIFDGYDLVVYGVVLPVLMQEWGLTPVQAGALGSYALFGMMIGAIVFGQLADRIGRRLSIAICIVLFSGFTFINGFATNVTEFGICRFIAGLGIGGVMPNVVALMNEYAPKKMRGTLVAIMFSGYSVGGMMAAWLGMQMIPQFGWQSVFYIAILPLVLLPVILLLLPESLAFLLRQNKVGAVREIITKIAPKTTTFDMSVKMDTSASEPAIADKPGVKQLFTADKALPSVLLWCAFFCCLLMVYALTSWLPKLMNNAGFSLGSSLQFLLVLNVGAIAGAIFGGWLGDRSNLPRVLTYFFIAAAVSITLMGLDVPMVVRYLAIAIAGAATIGSQILLYACAAQYYPLHIRSTGLGWASGIGRNGAIVGPLLGGYLLSEQLALHLNFMVFAVPGIICAIAMAVFNLYQSRTNSQLSQLA